MNRVRFPIVFVALISLFALPRTEAQQSNGVGYVIADQEIAGSVQQVDPAVDEFVGSAAQNCNCPPSNTGKQCGCRGWRSQLEERGITLFGNSAHFAFGIDGGINTPVPPPLKQGDTFEYTGRGEYGMKVDLEKFGGLPKGTLTIAAQHWYGEFGNVSLASGAFAPPIFPAILPPEIDSAGVPYITDFFVTQPLSQKLVVFGGKKNVLGAADQDIFAGGNGIEGFMNQSLMANPAFLLGLPYSGFTMGAVMPRDWGGFSVFVYDPQDRTRDFFRLKDLFSEGVIVGGEVKAKTNFLNKPGEHHVGAMWKHLDQPDLAFNEPPPGQYPYPQIPGVATIDDAYTIYYGFDQYLRVFSTDEKTGKSKGWGLFGRASISDGNPTLLKYFLSGGIGGDSPLGCDRGDKFGVGWYYVGASNEFGPVPTALFGPRDGGGLEMFYNYKASKKLSITPDVQLIKPGAGGIAETGFIYGLRLNYTF